jgi:hypothetical protein
VAPPSRAPCHVPIAHKSGMGAIRALSTLGAVPCDVPPRRCDAVLLAVCRGGSARRSAEGGGMYACIDPPHTPPKLLFFDTAPVRGRAVASLPRRVRSMHAFHYYSQGVKLRRAESHCIISVAVWFSRRCLVQRAEMFKSSVDR